ASPQLQQSLAAPGAAQAQVLAGAGIWYDALDDLSRAIAADPKSQALWNERASLFEQAGLPAFPLSGDAAPGLRPR
ncbi:MAG: DUF928 domain-containing protein, partial [Myxococcota bacterium]|nr:DUF928 domain-containing protein [Myxococcota bacterium]